MVMTQAQKAMIGKYPSRNQVEGTLFAQMKDFTVNFGALTPIKGLPVEAQIEPVLFTLCVGGEARGETEEGISLVCDVILNRWRKQLNYWGRSISKVILDQNANGIFEFSCMHPKSPTYKWMQSPDALEYLKVFKIAIPKYFQMIPVENRNVTYYHTADLKPPLWVQKLYFYKEVGNHIFYTDCLLP